MPKRPQTRVSVTQIHLTMFKFSKNLQWRFFSSFLLKIVKGCSIKSLFLALVTLILLATGKIFAQGPFCHYSVSIVLDHPLGAEEQVIVELSDQWNNSHSSSNVDVSAVPGNGTILVELTGLPVEDCLTQGSIALVSIANSQGEVNQSYELVATGEGGVVVIPIIDL